MQKPFIRLGTFFLISCLIADPLQAATEVRTFSYNAYAFKGSRTFFTRQALSPVAFSPIHPTAEQTRIQIVQAEEHLSAVLLAPNVLSYNSISVQDFEDVLRLITRQDLKYDDDESYSEFLEKPGSLKVLERKAKNDKQRAIIEGIRNGEIKIYGVYGDFVFTKNAREAILMVGHAGVGKSFLTSKFFSVAPYPIWEYGGHDGALIFSYHGAQFIADDYAVEKINKKYDTIRWVALPTEKPSKIR